MDATLAWKRAPKVSHYYPNSYSRMNDAKSNIRIPPSEMGPRPIGKRLQTWGVSSRPSMVGVSMQLQGIYAISQEKFTMNHCIL